MNGDDFYFTRYLPTVDDASAASRSCRDHLEFERTHVPLNLRPGESDVHYYHVGFNRGTAWALQQYAQPLVDELVRMHDIIGRFEVNIDEAFAVGLSTIINHEAGSDPDCKLCRTIASARERLVNAH